VSLTVPGVFRVEAKWLFLRVDPRMSPVLSVFGRVHFRSAATVGHKNRTQRFD
jgi:hypothetical protein